MSVPLSGKRKAAVLLITLGPEVSGSVLRELREGEIEQLTLEIAATEGVDDDIRRVVLAECYQMGLANRFLTSGGLAYAQEMLAQALGDDQALEIMKRLSKNMRPQHFDFLRESDPAQLAQFIQEEQPQAIALILSHLQPSTASRVLSALPAELQTEVSMRIAMMERTPPEVVEGIETVLRRRLSSIITSEYTSVGGIEYLVKVLTQVDRGTERVILSYLQEQNAELADEVLKLMFVFDNLIQLDDASLQRVLREVDPKDLTRALRGASEQLRDRIFRNLSTRAADMLREDMAVAGPVRLKQVEEAQQKIVNIVRRLEESGDIVIQRGGDDVLI